jgi:hypothetical protein
MESESLAAAADDGVVTIWNVKARLGKAMTPHQHLVRVEAHLSLAPHIAYKQ